MSIIWCGGEDIDFPNGSVSIDTNTTRFRSAYSRCGLYATSGVIKSNVFPGGAITSCWFSFNTCTNNPGTAKKICGLVKGSTVASGLYVCSASASGTRVALGKYNGTTLTQLAAEVGNSMTNGVHKFDVHLTSFGASATVDVYIDENLIITYSGDVTVTGVTDLDAFAIADGAVGSFYSSEFIVADEDTRLMSLKTLTPNAAGDATEWTNGYTNIDEVTNSDADTVYSSTAGQNFQCSLTGMPAGDFSVKAVKCAARMSDAVGGMGVKQGIKTNEALDLGSAITLPTAWTTYERMYQANPITSSAFTPTEIEALQLAFQSASV